MTLVNLAYRYFSDEQQTIKTKTHGEIMIRLIQKHFLSVFVVALMMSAFTMDIQAQVMNTLWERTDRTGAQDTLPGWFTVGSVRGMAYGTVDGNTRVYAADRANSTIRVMNAATGADVTPATAFDLSGVGGGTFAMNDVEVSDDGVIFLGNLTTDANASPFRLYWWTSEGGAYADSLTITTSTAQRLGDKFTVKGSVSDNSIEIWLAAAGSNPGIVHVLTTSDNGASWNVETITLSGSNVTIPSNSDAAPLELGRTGDFYIVGNGTSPKRYNASGEYVANSQFPAAEYTGSRNGLNTFKLNGESHLSVYTYRPDGTDTGNKTGTAIVYNVADTTSPVTVATSPLMGNDVDTFSSIHGEAHPRVNSDGTVNIYAMDGVNGFASYTNSALEASSLFISEYIEGSSNNKALELYNNTGDVVDLSNFQMYRANNGSAVWQDTLELTGTLAAGEVYVIANPSADQVILDEADLTDEITFYNGNDAIGLAENISDNWILIDGIGVLGEDPAAGGWEIAGVTDATGEHTILRKSSVMTGNTDWAASAGTNAEDSEWIVLDQNDFSNIGQATPAPASEPVTVTFRVNTATIPDTLKEDGFVQIRGNFIATLDSAAYGAQNVTWDGGSTPVATNDGGDYWSVDVQMAPGDSLVYKYYVGLDESTGVNDNGWEANGPFNGNYLYVLPDTTENVTRELVYFNNGQGRVSPIESADDSLSVYFRVNVGAFVQDGSFDPETDKVGVRGLPDFFGNPGDWGSTAEGSYLSQGGSKGDNLFYNGTIKVPETAADTLTNVEYKFVLETESGTLWDSDPNRAISVPAEDSTVMWVNFQNTKPTDAVIVDTELNFEVNVGILEGLGLFNSSIDTVSVRGTFNGWGEERMDFNQVLGTYEALNYEYTKAEGTTEKYKYYIKWDARRDSSESEFFLDGIEAANSGWEEPGVTGGADRTFTIENQPSQDKLSEFYNGVEPEALLTSDNVDGGAITVTFSIDMSPATSSELSTPFVPASDSVFLFVDTPFFALTNGITVPGDNGQNFITQSQAEIDRLMFTDDNNDMVYELELDLQLPTLNHIGFRIAYGEPTSADGQLVANGGGFDAGRRHYQYIQPMVDANLDVSWPSTFSFPQLTWKESDLPFELPPDYSTVGNEDLAEVENFRLDQNYPNPFNPSTTISFNLPNAADVNLTVYNILGQRVATLLNNKAYTSGSHTISFDASNLASGIYIYRLEAGSFTSQKRMTLIK